MNEEEKQAINYLKDFRDNVYAGVGTGSVMAKNIDIIFAIIDKQQKEIEELKDELKEERNLNKSALETLKECVHKDKIKEKIEEITSYAYTSLEEKEKQDYAIYELKRLLEE